MMMTKTIFAILTTFQQKKNVSTKKPRARKNGRGKGEQTERKQRREKENQEFFCLSSLSHETIYVGKNVILPLFLS
jgi:hypothetical protein